MNMMETDAKSEGEGGRSDPDPILLFPEEVWETILRELTDSRDIVSVFKAFPVLDGLVLKNKYWWLLDQVLPHIFPLLEKNEILSCRQICRRWTQGVDNFLENLPTRRAYLHGAAGAADPLWIPEASQTTDYLNLYYRFVQNFTGTQTPNMNDLLRGRNNHPPGRNPIVGRSVAFFDFGIDQGLPVGGGRLEYGSEMLRRTTNFWNMAGECFRTFGGHISFLDLTFNFLVSFGRIRPVVIDCLHTLPNLKLLRFECLGMDFRTENEEEQYDPEWLETHMGSWSQDPRVELQPLPRLPHLETLEFVFGSGFRIDLPLSLDTVKYLVSGYSLQIRKLELNYGFWRDEYCELFPKLTQFTMFDCPGKETVTKVLFSLLAPELQSLRLEIEGCLGSEDVADIFSCLGRFPRLASFTFHPLYSVRDGEPLETPKRPRYDPLLIPSLKSFEVTDWMDVKMGLTELQRFPFLEYLKIEISTDNAKMDGMEVKYPNIWEMLPKLKKVILPASLSDRDHDFIFTRARYEWAKRKWGLVEPSPSRTVLNALRASCFPWNGLGQPQHFEEVDSLSPDDDSDSDNDEGYDFNAIMEPGQPQPEDEDEERGGW